MEGGYRGNGRIGAQAEGLFQAVSSEVSRVETIRVCARTAFDYLSQQFHLLDIFIGPTSFDRSLTSLTIMFQISVLALVFDSVSAHHRLYPITEGITNLPLPFLPRPLTSKDHRRRFNHPF